MMLRNPKVLFWCRFMESTLTLGLISLPLISQLLIWGPSDFEMMDFTGTIYPLHDVPSDIHPDKLSLAIQSAISDLIICVMLWQFHQVFKSIRMAVVFGNKQVQRIKVTGVCFIALSIYSLISDLLLSLMYTSTQIFSYTIEFNNMVYLPIGAGLLILSHVLRLASDIEAEQELVI